MKTILNAILCVAFVNLPVSSSAQVISGCVKTINDLYVSGSCKSNETSLKWNATGPQGLQGIAGPQGIMGGPGAPGPIGPKGATGPIGPSDGYYAIATLPTALPTQVEVGQILVGLNLATFVLPAGKYVIQGIVNFYSNGRLLPADVTCSIQAANQQPGASYSHLSTALIAQNSTSIPVSSVISLTDSAIVNLTCATSQLQRQIDNSGQCYAGYTDPGPLCGRIVATQRFITAIKVGNLTSASP